MATITLERVDKKYGAGFAVDGLSLRIEQGELVALVGPSGCGKTTTLRMIAGLTEASDGVIHFDDRDVTNLPTYRRNTGIVFQGYALFPHMTVADNIAFGLHMRRIKRPDAARLVREALALVQLEDYAERYPRQLSGGQQQRVALARAIVIKPDVLLLDEPLSALDAKLRVEVRTEIRRLQSSLNLTTIFVTHDQEEAVGIADRIVVMNAGKVEQVGTPRDVYERPTNRFVANFIGLSNFITGRDEGGGCFRSQAGQLLRFEADRIIGPAEALVVRPEMIELGAAPSGSPYNELEGTIDIITYLGAVTDLELLLDSGERVHVHRSNRTPGYVEQFRRGERLTVHWPPSASLPI
jgi:putative spermidine/putrescine transport system ATP-binding protein